MNHAPFALHFEPTANQTQEPDRDKNTLMLPAELGQNMWLPPACPPSLYLETYLSQKEVCRAKRHSAGHRDEGSAPSCPLWVPPPLTYRHRASPEWPDVSVFAPFVQILKQKNPKWAELRSSRLFPVSRITYLTVPHMGSSSREG